MDEGSAKGPRPPRNLAAELPQMLASLAVAFGWVVLGCLSLLTGLLALVTALALAHEADEEASTWWMWAVALFITFGIPFFLAAWKHHREPRRIRASMAWLPTVWNAGGLILATQLVPDLVGTALRSAEWVVQGQFGDSHAATRVMSSLGHEAADLIDPPKPAFPAPLHLVSEVAPERAIAVPFADEGAAIFLAVQLNGPAGSIDREYLFDTGASYTTLTSDSAAAIGIEVPDDAPTLQFNTATGPRESRMVYLPSLTLGDLEIRGLLVSVCDSCATSRTAGLLGLNVMREFFVQMDYQGRRMQLLPRVHQANANRSYDIEPVMDMEIEGRPEIWLGRVRWVVKLTNRGTVPVRDLVPRVEFRAGPVLMGELVPKIEPGETARSLLQGKATDEQGNGSVEFTLTLSEARW